MESADTRYSVQRTPPVARFSRGALGFFWQAVRLPLLSVLSLLEPVVCFVLASLAILGVVAALVWKLSATTPSFPLWGLLTFSGGSLVLLALYYALIRLLSR